MTIIPGILPSTLRASLRLFEIAPSDLVGIDIETCPACGGELVERKSKHGSFIGCMNYPDCGYTRGLEHKPVTLHGASS